MGHVATDPDSEIITATVVTPGNASDGSVAEDLIADLLADDDKGDDQSDDHGCDGTIGDQVADAVADDNGAGGDDNGATVYGDNAYGTGSFQDRLEDVGIDSKCKTQGPNATNGMFGKDRFGVDLGADTVTCPAGVTVSIRRHADGGGMAKFADAWASCGMRPPEGSRVGP